MRAWQRQLLMPFVNYVTYTGKVQAIAAANLIAYWPMAEASGTVALDASGNGRTGTYTAVTLGADGIGDGRTSASFDGSTSYNTVFSASLAGAFNGAEGTMAGWCMVSGSGVWTDGTLRRILYIRTDANNLIFMQRSASNNALTLGRVAGGTTKSVSPATSSTGWLHVACTWSESGDAVKVYLNGAQSGATQTTVGTYAGALTSGRLGANSTSVAELWSGRLAHVALWSTPLSAAQIAVLATV